LWSQPTAREKRHARRHPQDHGPVGKTAGLQGGENKLLEKAGGRTKPLGSKK
jgi:hypothetical protein